MAIITPPNELKFDAVDELAEGNQRLLYTYNASGTPVALSEASAQVVVETEEGMQRAFAVYNLNSSTPASDIDVNSFKEGVIQTSLSDASTDEQIPTAAATVSYVGGVISNYTTTAELNVLLADKVDKVTTTGSDRVYGITSEGVQTVYPLPTVGNGTITLTQGGVSKGTFTVNQSSDTTIDFEQGTSVELAPNLSIVGSPTINNGNVSDFTNADYMQFPFALDFTNVTAIEMVAELTTGADVTTQQNILDSYYGIAYAVLNGHLVLSLSSNGTSWDIGSATGTATIEANTTYHTKLSWDGSQYTLGVSTDGGQTYATDITIVSSVKPNITAVYVGGSPDLYGVGTAHPFGGVLNLNGWSIERNGVAFWLGMDDIGLDTRANVDLSNLSGLGEAKFNAKQDLLESGVNIKTVGGQTMLGSGDIPLPSGGGAAYLFQHQWSDHILTEANWLRADTFEWHSGVSYPDAYDELVSEYNDPDAVSHDDENYTIVGSPTIVDGIASGFSSSNYLQVPTALDTSVPWEYRTKIVVKNITTGQYFFQLCSATYSVQVLIVSTGNFRMGVSSNGTSWDKVIQSGTLALAVDDVYYVKLGWDGETYYLDYSTDNENWTRDIGVVSRVAAYNNGTPAYITTSAGPYLGDIDLNYTSFINSSHNLWNARFVYKTTPKGYYITTPEFIQVISNFYTVGGKELYYLLDTTNTQFKLPRVGLVYSYFYGAGESDPLSSPATLGTTLPMANTDLSNISPAAASVMSSGCVPDYSAGVLLTSYTSINNRFTAPCAGYILYYKAGTATAYINNTNITGSGWLYHLPVDKGDTFYSSTFPTTSDFINKFYPYRGAI